MDNEQLLRELEEKKCQSRLMQKKVIVCVIAAAILCFVIYGVMAIAESGWFVTVEYQEADGGFLFDPNIDYEYNIMEDHEYLRLIKDEPLISFCDNNTGITESLTDEQYDDYGDAVKLLTDLVLAIQAGDYETYYSFFTEGYLAAERASRIEQGLIPDPPFTMQQIYGAVITRVSEEKNPQTGALTCTYRLKYMIHENNGTLRLDMGSDAYREQELVMLGGQNDTALKINSVSTEKTVYETEIVHGWRIAAVAVATVALAALTVFGTVIILKKLGRGKAEENAQ